MDELARSASEASKISLAPIQIDRYINPPADTMHALEYAFHLLGDVCGKTVLDLGCGSGENIVPLLCRGARVIGMDISPELIQIAQQRVGGPNPTVRLTVGDAYNTGLPLESVDVIMCASLIHHLDINRAADEMFRVLRRGGIIILKEPVRFSRVYAHLRALLPAQEDISEDEHPLTKAELLALVVGFHVEAIRYFRLPFVPLVSKLLPSKHSSALRASNWMIQHFSPVEHYATCVVARLKKT